MGKNFVATNFKYFKNSSVDGVLGHVMRSFKENKNAFPEFTKDNFGTGDLFNKYEEVFKRVNERKAELKTKRLNKTSNTLIEGAFVFSLDRWEELEKEHSKEELQTLITERMNDYMLKCKEEFGFEPIGFEMHLDEGHMKQIKAKENNPDQVLVRNIHAHVDFFNYDFKNDCAPLRAMKKKDWSKCQDLAAECFKDLGFQRGISKEITKEQHLEKDAYIDKKQKEEIRELKEKNKQLNEKLKEKENQIKAVNSRGREKVNKLKTVKNRIEEKEKIEKELDDKLSELNMNVEFAKSDLEEVEKETINLVNLVMKLPKKVFNVIQKTRDFLNKTYSSSASESRREAATDLVDHLTKIEEICPEIDGEGLVDDLIEDTEIDNLHKDFIYNEVNEIKEEFGNSKPIGKRRNSPKPY